LHQRIAVDIEQIERVIKNENAVIWRTVLSVSGEAATLLHQAEGGSSGFVGCNNFAVENAVAALKLIGDRLQLGKGFRLIILISRDHADGPLTIFAKEDDGAISVPLDLVEPVRII